MNLIFTQKQAREKIEGLESRIAELEADAIAKEDGIELVQNELATAREDLAAKQSRIEELEAKASKVEELEAKVQAAETKVTETEKKVEETKESVDKEAAKKAVEIVAEAGLEKPIEATPRGEAKTLSLTEFRQLTPFQKSQFFRDGGKLTD